MVAGFTIIVVGICGIVALFVISLGERKGKNQ